jgi:HJR/Mrr/RecB family endonuclease
MILNVNMLHTPPSNPDIKRELKNQLLNLTPRGFELFAGEFLVYVGLEKVSVTRYIGDGGIDVFAHESESRAPTF